MKPGYKQTEVGVIPEEWEICLLQKVADPANPITYGVLKPGNYIANGIPLLQIRDVIYGEIDINQLHRISEDLSRQYSRTKLLGGEIVVSLVGTIGRVALLPVSLEGGNLHRNLARINVSKANDSKFLYYFLNSDRAQTAIKLSTFGSSQALLNLTDLRNLLIPLPPLPEQRAIAAALSDVDALLGGLERLITKKRDLKQAAMQQLLTGQTRLPGFDGAWEVKTIGAVCQSYSGGTPSTTKPEFYGGEIPFIRSAEIARNKTELSLTSEGLINSSAKMITKGDVLVALYGANSGDVALATIDGAINQAILCLKSEESNAFLYQFLSFKKNWIVATFIQGGQGNLSGEIIKSITLSFPPLPEQIAIAAMLSDMDAELVALEQRRTKTRALKQAMMQELLTGKTRLMDN